MKKANLKINKDAYGQEIMEYLKTGYSLEIVEREDGYIGPSEGSKHYFSEYKNWEPTEKKAIAFAKGRVLDIGTGAGRVALYLQKKKLPVLAIDNSPLAIKVCKKRGVKNAIVLPIEKISSLSTKHFDTIVMFGNNFGLFGSYKKARQLLKTMYKITNPGALIIAESTDPHNTNDPNHTSYHKLNLRRGRMAGQVKIRIRFDKAIGNWFDYLLVSKNGMKKIISGTGWRIKKFIDAKKYTYFAIIEKVDK